MIKSWDTFNMNTIKRIPLLPKGRGRRKKKVYYLDTVTAFDIETTNIDKYQQAVMYIWQWQIGKTTVIGRTWEDFKTFYDQVNEAIPDGVSMVVYVHNLSFEYQFLKDIIPVDTIFAMDARKILKFTSGKLEFRCSYLQSNMSLDSFLKQMKVSAKKVKGFDYAKKRYSWTKLDKAELRYCVNDVKGLRQAMIQRMEMHNDNLYTIPLTSTGYSRRLAKKALGGYSKYIKFMLPGVDVMHALRDCFRGGDTHANRWNSNILLDAEKLGGLGSRDISSSYPTQMLIRKFPGEFAKGDIRYFDTYLRNDYGILMYIDLFDIQLKDPAWGDPYIAKAKCLQIDGGVFDNGRLLSADACRLCINEIDLRIIMSEYKFESFQLDPDRFWIANKRKLPYKLRDLLLDTYAQKTALKGTGNDLMYNHQKALFNSYYGMMVQNPVKPNYILNEAGDLVVDPNDTFESLVQKYQEDGWLPYQWGVWVTSYARYQLHEGLHCIPPECFIYCDTDSVKYIGNHDRAFERLNRKYYDPDLIAYDAQGKPHQMGIFEDDGSYKKFKTMGAKKYCYVDENDQLHITISGVNKYKGPAELGSIENFKEGFKFKAAGGTESIFNDHPDIGEIRIQGHRQKITSNIMIQESTYTLGLTLEYKRLLNYLSNTDIRYSLHYER